MKKRKDVEKELSEGIDKAWTIHQESYVVQKISLEVLLDIRDLLDARLTTLEQNNANEK